MSISGALSNALTGLNASSRAAGVVSTNLANILTDGYAPRDIELVTQGDGHGGGVTVAAVTRRTDPALLNERRLADSAVANSETLATFSAKLEVAVGTPDQVGSLTARISNLDAALLAAASRPEEFTRLNEVSISAGQLSDKLNEISEHIQVERTSIDGQIATAVSKVNQTLEQIQALNAQIVNSKNTSNPSASMLDQRQSVIDTLAEYIPVRITERANGAVAIYSPGGAVLVDGKPASLRFQESNVVEPHMTIENNLISGLEINNASVNTSNDRGPISGGRLAALFEVRDVLTVDAQSQVDAIARNLIERFQKASADPTLQPGDPGIFTDGGGAFDAVNEVGVSSRISLNILVDANVNGDVWRIRDGLGSVVQGPVGNSTQLTNLKAALGSTDALTTGSLGSTERPFLGHAASLTSKFGQQRLSIEQSLSFSNARQAGLFQTELQNGVDSDAELQRLLLIEQAYSANARMVQTVEELLDTLLRI